MIFVVAPTYQRAIAIARREVRSPSEFTWLNAASMHKIRGMNEPRVLICGCQGDDLTHGDWSMIESRRAHLTVVPCQ
ncbi:MAG: hypothetical protein V4515_14350 [Chloroflexota bacterium]